MKICEHYNGFGFSDYQKRVQLGCKECMKPNLADLMTIEEWEVKEMLKI